MSMPPEIDESLNRLRDTLHTVLAAERRRSRHVVMFTSAITAGAIGLAAVASQGCGSLDRNGEAAILAAHVGGCVALAYIPVAGPALAAACVGEEATLRAALDATIAAQADAGAVDAGGEHVAVAVSALASAPPTVLVTRRHKGIRRPCGYVPPSLAAGVQARLDGAP